MIGELIGSFMIELTIFNQLEMYSLINGKLHRDGVALCFWLIRDVLSVTSKVLGVLQRG